MLARRNTSPSAPLHAIGLRTGFCRTLVTRVVALLLTLGLAASAFAFDPFTVKDIRVEGVQRTEAGTIFSYLPIKVGERIDDEKAAQAVKALYATGFFRDVRIEAQGDVLIVTVQERPTISSLTFVGNKEFDTDTIKKALKEVGIAEGRIFDRSALDRAEQELKRQYITRGKYAARVETTVTPQDRNRVAVNFNIVEGDTANIARINIVGNKTFSEKQLRSEISLSTPNWLSWYTKDDQYSKQKLQADLEALRSFYQNRGYLEFQIESTQVSISPDKDEVYVTININEGQRFTVSGVQIAGELVVSEPELRGLLAGVGYSSNDGVVFNASISQQNIFGSGNALALAVNTSRVNRTVSLTYTEPFWTVDGVSRTFELYNKNIDPTGLSVAQYASSTLGGAVGFGVPVSEIDTINYGLRVEHTSLSLFANSPPVYYQFVQDFGYVTNSYIVSAGWSRDTRNDILYPSFGRLQSALVEVGLPFGDLAYYKFQYINQSFYPVYGDFVLMLRADLGYGDGLQQKPFPFFKAFYAGGAGSVRGYQSGSLGPRDIYGNTLGGKRKIVGNAELFYPILKGERSVRISGFFDAGQIYVNGFQPQFENFRYSAGLGLAWNSPIGPLKFSYAIPISSIPEDKKQKFQFQVGSVF